MDIIHIRNYKLFILGTRARGGGISLGENAWAWLKHRNQK